jgi:hypothetical protein
MQEYTRLPTARALLYCSSFGVGAECVFNCALALSKLRCELLYCYSYLLLSDNPLAFSRTKIWATAHILIYFLSKLAQCRHSYNALKL